MRADQIVGKAARIVDRVANGVLRDFVKNHAMHVLVVQRTFLPQELDEVPGDCFAFAVRVRREVERIGLFQRADDRVDVLLVALDDLVLHREALIGIDSTFFRHEIANVPVRSQHVEILSQVFRDGLRLGGRFNDDEVF